MTSGPARNAAAIRPGALSEPQRRPRRIGAISEAGSGGPPRGPAAGRGGLA